MSSLTTRFGLSYFGGATPGSLADDGAKFTLDDPQVLDRILAALEAHTHTGGDQLADPADPPTADLATIGGTLPSDRTYYYCVSFVDQFGLETRAGDEVDVQTPQSVLTPAGPAVEAVSGGDLGAGLYYYALTIVTDADETQLSEPTLIGITEGTGTAILTLPVLPADGQQFRIWRQGPSESGFSKIGLSADLTFVDDGSVEADPCACDPANLPPADNTTNSTNVITISLSDMDTTVITLPGQNIRAWRLYRTEVSGNYGAESLVEEVVARQDPQDLTSPLVTSWIDYGDPTINGRPRPYSQTLRPPGLYLFPLMDELPDPAEYPAGYSLIVDGVLYVNLAGVWSSVGGAGTTTSPQTTAPWPDFILTGADGRRWRQTVDATGALVLVQTLLPAAPVPPANLVVEP